MQNVINTVKGKALEVAEYLTPVLKVLVRAGAMAGRRAGGLREGEVRRALPEALEPLGGWGHTPALSRRSGCGSVSRRGREWRQSGFGLARPGV